MKRHYLESSEQGSSQHSCKHGVCVCVCVYCMCVYVCVCVCVCVLSVPCAFCNLYNTCVTMQCGVYLWRCVVKYCALHRMQMDTQRFMTPVKMDIMRFVYC